MASVTNTKYAQQAWQFSLSIGTWLVCKYADVTTVHNMLILIQELWCMRAQYLLATMHSCRQMLGTDCQCHLVVITVWLPVFILSVYAEE